MMTTVHSPLRAKPRTWPSTSSASCGVSTEVGSSRISRRGLRKSCFSSSSFCFSPAARACGFASRSSLNGVVSRNAASRSRSRRQSMRAGTRPPASNRFSATVMPGASVKCWYTMPMPSSRATTGLAMACSRPSTSTLPLVGRWKPATHFTSVLLPAPFSPSSACTVPGATFRFTSRRASNPPKRMPRPQVSSDMAPRPRGSAPMGVAGASIMRSLPARPARARARRTRRLAW